MELVPAAILAMHVTRYRMHIYLFPDTLNFLLQYLKALHHLFAGCRRMCLQFLRYRAARSVHLYYFLILRIRREIEIKHIL